MKLTVGSARGAALAPVDDGTGSTVGEVVAAVALVTELNTGQGEALALAEARAVVEGHVRGGRRRAGKRTPVRSLSDTSGVGPPRGKRLDGVDKAGLSTSTRAGGH